MKKQEKLGKYEIRRELGRGATGVVYEAFDPLIERTVAIKTILKSAIDKREAEEIFSRFRREARAAGRLSHPKIVSIYEYGEDDDKAFIVMELIRGKELKEYFDHEDRFTIGDGISIVLQILDALDYSHARGVVHRDIKPANIMITNDGQIKIADFGIAKIDSLSLTHVGGVLGTPTYMSPEQFTGHEVDHRADIYAAGVILYQFLTGKRPFTGSVITIMHQAMHQEATPPSQLNPDVSKQLDEVVQKAMAKRPEERFQSATEFMGALKAAAQALPAPGHRGVDADATMIGTHEAFVSNDAIARTAEAEEQARLQQETQVRLALEEKARKEAEQRVALEQAKTLAEAEATRQRDAEKEALLARTNAELKNETARVSTIEAEKRKQEEEQARLKQEAQARLVLEEKLRKEAAQREAQEQAQRQAKALAEAEARRQRDAEKKALLARKIAEMKIATEKAKAAEAEKRKREAEEQARRDKELLASMSEHARKFAEVVAEREAAADAERRMQIEAQRKAEADAEEQRQREAIELAAREKELAAARAAERLENGAEEQAAHAGKRTRFIITLIAVLSALLVGALLVLFLSQK